ncbi:MAG: hypothetical protein HWN81_12100 [Candidatus Lokiarchaeota archaeon]|nr:hypothetical protein [Candidatus Lokiarchaeota archaeon]
MIEEKLNLLKVELAKANQLLEKGCSYEEEVLKSKKRLIFLLHFYEHLKEDLNNHS